MKTKNKITCATGILSVATLTFAWAPALMAQPVTPPPAQPMNPPPPATPPTAPVNPSAPNAVNPTVPNPVNPAAPNPVNPVAPNPVNPVAPNPVNPVAPNPLPTPATPPPGVAGSPPLAGAAPQAGLPVAPPPGVSVNIGVPENYAWDGYEYVGVIGGQYYYLGPGNTWLPMAGNRLAQFRAWEGQHHDWRMHAMRNELYRRDAQGQNHPLATPAHDGH